MSLIQSEPSSNHNAAGDRTGENWIGNDSFYITQGSTSRTTTEVIEDLEVLATVVDIYRLSYMQSSLFASLVGDAIKQLQILAATNNGLRVCKTLNEINLLRSLKYDVEQPADTDELDGISRSNISSDSYKLKKLDNDREHLGKTLKATYLELSENRNWKVLAGTIKKHTDILEHRTRVAEEETKNRGTRRDLARQLRQLRNHVKSANYDTNIIIERLRNKVEDSAIDVEVRTRYTNKWERARYEQHKQTLLDVEAPPSKATELYKRHVDHEQRVHVEIELLTNICETLGKVESWMNKYDKDIEAIDLKIQIKKNEYQLEQERREELEKKLEIHEYEMNNWIHFKEERERVRLHREKMHESAITVQAWWRGLIVRLQLGPYKVVKKPAKSGAKKK